MRLLLCGILLATVAAGSDNGNPRPAAPYVPPVLREPEAPETAVVTLPAPPVIEEGSPPVLRHAAPAYPTEFAQDSIAFLENRLNQWRQADAQALLGLALRSRPSYDDNGKPNGSIFAYADPLHRYKEFELDFEGESGKLRSVFVYPPRMSWQECRATFGANVARTDAGKGRSFLSYRDRRLDVLVDAAGNVISLGIY